MYPITELLRINLFVVESTKMATFLRRVPFLVYVFVLIAVKLCSTQVVGADRKLNLNDVNLNQNEIPNKLNIGANMGNPNMNPNLGQPAGNLGHPVPADNVNPQNAGHLPLANKLQQGFGQGVGDNQMAGFKPQVGPNNPLKYEAGKSLRTLMLAEHPDCIEDVQNICSKTMKRNNFAVLDCLEEKVIETQKAAEVKKYCAKLNKTVTKLTNDILLWLKQQKGILFCKKKIPFFREKSFFF